MSSTKQLTGPQEGSSHLTALDEDDLHFRANFSGLRRGSSKRLKIVKTASKKSLQRLGSKLGLRRGSLSSYPDLFEGETSNSVCNKSLYTTSTLAEDRTDPAECLTLKIDNRRIEPQNQVLPPAVSDSQESKKQNLSQKILSSWFFKRKDECDSTSLLPTKDSDTSTREPNLAEYSDDTTTADSERENGRKKKLSLSQLISKQFSAATDFNDRQLNVTIPQSM